MFELHSRKVISDWQKYARARLQQAVERFHHFQMSPTGLTALIGVRRCGKTTLALQLAHKNFGDDFLYINFEDPLFIEFNTFKVFDQILEQYLRENGKHPRCIVFDELQVIQGWEKWIRKAHDLKQFEIIMTGSSSKLLSRELGTALSGRSLSYRIWPLGFREYLKFSSMKSEAQIPQLFSQFIEEGGFPEISFLQDSMMKKELLRQYLNDIVLKDIMARHSIKDKWQLDKVMFHLMQNLASHHTSNAISKAYDISPDTILKFLDFLNDCFVAFPVFRYHRNLKVQARDSRKYYVIDTGLRNSMTQMVSTDYGKLIENAVFIELCRQSLDVYYFKEDFEVDFLVLENRKPALAIQVTDSDLSIETTKERELNGLRDCLQKTKVPRLMLVNRSLSGLQTIDGMTVEFVTIQDFFLRPEI